MRMPSASQRRSLDRAATAYQSNLILADSFLRARGVDLATANQWRLGVVSLPEPGHEHAIGRLSIPYINRAGVMALKFRCLADHACKEHDCTKYLAPQGQETYIFNVAATDTASRRIHICEGELDAVVLEEALGEPAVGIPGASMWQPHWVCHFRGFDQVIAWPDGDKAGRDLGNRLRKEIEAVEVVSMPAGKDVTNVYLEAGTVALRALAGIEDYSPEVAHA